MNPENGVGGEILRLKNITKTFNGRRAVNDISFEIRGRVIYGLLGPNGAGKTTLLRMITGLLRPTQGNITLFGAMRPGQSEAKKKTGYMPQSLAIYPGLSVQENIAFFGRIYGMRGDLLGKRVDEVLDIVELRDRRHSPVSELSGGTIRRVLLASALVHRPHFLLLDEPTSGVDPLLRIKIWDLLERLTGDGTAVLITTHHISEAQRCRRVLFLREGTLVDEDTPANLMQKYCADNLEEAFVSATRSSRSGDTQ